jgi:small subunit ribosomal protein S9
MTAAVTVGLGRRKSAVARVRIQPGAGGFLVNGRAVDEFFRTIQSRQRVRAALAATETAKAYDISINVRGGGPSGQADAVVLGIARALK